MKKLTMQFIIKLLFICLLLSSSSMIHGNIHSKEEDILIFEKLFSDWSEAFNKKDLTKTCDLFSKTMTATYQGSPEKNYQSVCNKFKELFNQKNKQYQYRFEIHQVYRSLDLAVVRITWYLTVDELGKKTAVIQDEGLDVLQQDAEKQWKIVNFLGFGGALLPG